MISGPHRRVGIGAVAGGTLRRLGSLMITIRTSFRHEIILTRRLSLLAVPFRLPGRISRRSLLRLVLTHEGGHSFIGESFSSVSAGLARLGKGHGGGLASTADPHRGRRLLCPWRRRLCRRRATGAARAALLPGLESWERRSWPQQASNAAWAIGGRGLALSNKLPPSVVQQLLGQARALRASQRAVCAAAKKGLRQAEQ